MKNIYLIVLLCMFFSCKSQKSVLFEGVPAGMELGRCYYSYILQEVGVKQEGPFVLEIIPPQYVKVKKIINLDEIENYKVGEDQYIIQTLTTHVKYVFNDKSLIDFIRKKSSTGYMICLSVVSPESLKFTKSDLINNEFTYFYKKIESQAKIIKNSVKTLPKKLTENQRYFPAGKWSDLEHATYH